MSSLKEVAVKRFHLLFAVALSASMLIAACGPAAPTPEQPTRPAESVPTRVQALAQATPTSAPTAYPTLPSGCTPPANWTPYSVQSGDTLYALAQQSKTTPEEIMRANCLASALINPGQIIYLPLGPCTPAPLEGWGNYVVRGGDTLYSLAITHDTTMDEVKHANCLVSDALRAGQNLFLPPLRQLPATPIGCTTPGCTSGGAGELVVVPAPATTPPATMPPSPCDPFVCKPQSGIGDLPVPAGAPDDPANRKPCGHTEAKPWIDPIGRKSETDPTRPRVLELGERAYFFACEFPAGITTAIITMSNGLPQTVTLESSVLDPDLNKLVGDGPPLPLVAWAALPTHPLGRYALSIVGVPNVEPFEFDVRAPTREHILAVPVADSPGRVFQMYYVNFNLNDVAQIEFYEEDQSSTELSHTLSFRRIDLVRIDQLFPQPQLSSRTDKGWTMVPFSTEADYPRAAYGAAYDKQRIFTLFWLR